MQVKRPFEPVLPMPQDPRLQSLLVAWDDGNKSGSPLTPEELCRDCPELLDSLRRQIQAVERMQKLLPDSQEPQPATADEVTLTVNRGPHARRVFRFTEHSTFLVGRGAEAHFSLPDDPYLSRLHFLIEVNPPDCRLIDLGNKNGTRVNGRRVTAPLNLKNGDEIEAGQTLLLVSRAHEPEPLTRTLDLDSSGATPTIQSSLKRELPQVPGYEVLDEIGTGGMGVVYRARRLTDSLTVAIKYIPPDRSPTKESVARFRREMKILSRLEHPHIVRCLEGGGDSSHLYCVLEFVAGLDAAKLTQREQDAGRQLEVGRAVRLALDLLAGLAYLHDNGYVHRDVKPANLLVTHRGGQECGVLADFGLARAIDRSGLSGLTITGTTAGTPQYMPPEQITAFGHLKPTADQYSAAATLYEMLCGESVLSITKRADWNGEVFNAVLRGKRVSLSDRLPELPRALIVAVDRALAMEPTKRFADVTAFANALRPFASA